MFGFVVSVDEIEIDPAPVVIWTFDPATRVAKEYPPAFPINNWPLAGVWVSPVPPKLTPKALDNCKV